MKSHLQGLELRPLSNTSILSSIFSLNEKTAVSDPSQVIEGKYRGLFGSTSIFNETFEANEINGSH